MRITRDNSCAGECKGIGVCSVAFTNVEHTVVAMCSECVRIFRVVVAFNCHTFDQKSPVAQKVGKAIMMKESGVSVLIPFV